MILPNDDINLQTAYDCGKKAAEIEFILSQNPNFSLLSGILYFNQENKILMFRSSIDYDQAQVILGDELENLHQQLNVKPSPDVNISNSNVDITKEIGLQIAKYKQLIGDIDITKRTDRYVTYYDESIEYLIGLVQLHRDLYHSEIDKKIEHETYNYSDLILHELQNHPELEIYHHNSIRYESNNLIIDNSYNSIPITKLILVVKEYERLICQLETPAKNDLSKNISEYSDHIADLLKNDPNLIRRYPTCLQYDHDKITCINFTSDILKLIFLVEEYGFLLAQKNNNYEIERKIIHYKNAITSQLRYYKDTSINTKIFKLVNGEITFKDQSLTQFEQLIELVKQYGELTTDAISLKKELRKEIALCTNRLKQIIYEHPDFKLKYDSLFDGRDFVRPNGISELQYIVYLTEEDDNLHNQLFDTMLEDKIAKAYVPITQEIESDLRTYPKIKSKLFPDGRPIKPSSLVNIIESAKDWQKIQDEIIAQERMSDYELIPLESAINTYITACENILSKNPRLKPDDARYPDIEYTDGKIILDKDLTNHEKYTLIVSEWFNLYWQNESFKFKEYSEYNQLQSKLDDINDQIKRSSRFYNKETKDMLEAYPNLKRIMNWVNGEMIFDINKTNVETLKLVIQEYWNFHYQISKTNTNADIELESLKNEIEEKCNFKLSLIGDILREHPNLYRYYSNSIVYRDGTAHWENRNELIEKFRMIIEEHLNLRKQLNLVS